MNVKRSVCDVGGVFVNDNCNIKLLVYFSNYFVKEIIVNDSLDYNVMCGIEVYSVGNKVGVVVVVEEICGLGDFLYFRKYYLDKIIDQICVLKFFIRKDIFVVFGCFENELYFE